jgi:hypothetical protein
MTEEKYNFYKNSTKQNGGNATDVNANDNTNTANNQAAENKPTENKSDINTKINFKFSSLGNLDQTLKKDAKINIDKLLLRAIFGME